jgi:YidC/Oxa1 family membrane protein insertase
MFSYLYHTFVFNPLYNGFVFIFDVLPWIDVGLAVILFTIIIRLILFPLSKKAVITQVKMKEIEPELNRLKKEVPDRQEQAMKVMELYKNKGVNPFSSILLLFIQLPIIFALYSIFIRSGFPDIQTDLLYSFVSLPENIKTTFLGMFNVLDRSIIFALIAAISQFLQLHFSLASSGAPVKSDSPSMDAAQNAMKNMKYVFPVIVFIIAYKISAVVAIYWAVSSIFTLGQELVVRKHIKRHEPL